MTSAKVSSINSVSAFCLPGVRGSAVPLGRFVKRAQELGVALTEIDGLLRLRDDQERACSEVNAASEGKTPRSSAKSEPSAPEGVRLVFVRLPVPAKAAPATARRTAPERSAVWSRDCRRRICRFRGTDPNAASQRVGSATVVERAAPGGMSVHVGCALQRG